MEYSSSMKKFGAGVSSAEIEEILAAVRRTLPKNHNEKVYKRCFGAIDLTSLNSTDSKDRIDRFVTRAVELPNRYPDVPNVASVCVYPVFVETAGMAIGDSGMSITSVCGGFPSSQTYLEVKMLETAMAVENGADEVDVVISIGEFLNGEYDLMGNEIEMLRNEVGEDIVLKVILESGILAAPEAIHRASVIAMLAGTDFIKTSTGKAAVAATPEAAVVMCRAIRTFAEKTGRKVGFKAAGGISTAEDAVLYYTIAEQILGEEWLTPERFRIGASGLGNRLLSAIVGDPVEYF